MYKLVFYGFVGEVFVYFGRRVIENRDVIKRIEKERFFLWQELRRRIIFLVY